MPDERASTRLVRLEFCPELYFVTEVEKPASIRATASLAR